MTESEDEAFWEPATGPRTDVHHYCLPESAAHAAVIATVVSGHAHHVRYDPDDRTYYIAPEETS